MQLILFADVAFDNGTVALVEISQYFEEFFIGFVDPSDQI